MRDINRRGLLGAGLGTAAAIGLAYCGFSGSSGSSEGGSGKGDTGSGTGGKGDTGSGGNSGNGSPKDKVRLIGDSSTADTGKQPVSPPPRPARTRPDAAAVRDLFLGRGGRGRQRPLPALSGTGQGP